jgi:hypothetical protein
LQAAPLQELSPFSAEPKFDSGEKKQKRATTYGGSAAADCNEGWMVTLLRDRVWQWPESEPFTEKNSPNLFILVLLLEFAE